MRFIFFSTVLLVTTISKAQDSSGLELALEAYYQAVELAKSAEATLAAQRFLQAVELGFEPRQGYFSAMNQYLKAGKPDSAIMVVKQLVNSGFTDRRAFNEHIKSHIEWPEIEKRLVELDVNSKNIMMDLRNSSFIADDVQKFWVAFDKAGEAETMEEKYLIYRDEYFETGSRALKDFLFMKMRQEGGIVGFTRFVEEHRDYYEGIREAVSFVVANLSIYKDGLTIIKEFIPEASFSDTYFVIGMHTSFGTVSGQGAIIGLENVIDNSTPVHLLPESRRAVVKPASFLHWVIVHETIHNFQHLPDQTLLAKTIMEGTAELVTQLVLGEPVPTPAYRSFGRAHESMIWEKFNAQMLGSDKSGWVGSIGDTPNWERDLSYFIGYKIASRYYDLQEDKKDAIRELLDLKNPLGILIESGYAGF